jgi:hypothetical protein
MSRGHSGPRRNLAAADRRLAMAQIVRQGLENAECVELEERVNEWRDNRAGGEHKQAA